MKHDIFSLLLILVVFLVPQVFASGTALSASLPEKTPRHEISISFDLAGQQLIGTSRILLPPDTPLLLELGPLRMTGSVLEQDDKTPQIIQSGKDNIIHLAGAKQSRTLTLSWQLTADNPYRSGNLISPEGITLIGFWHPLPESPMPVTLTAALPRGFTGISEGDELTLTSRQGKNILHAGISHPLRGLHFAAGKYDVRQKKVGGVTLYSYFFPEDNNLAQDYLDAAAHYLKRYEKLIGPFPYRRYSIVENRLPTGYGMPGFTLLGQAVVRLPFIKDTSLGHEILHSWFGNSIGVPEGAGNWCEGLTSYLADQSFAADRGEDVQYRKNQLLRYRAWVHRDNSMTLADFSGAGDNRPIARKIRAIGYDKGSMFFHMLRKAIGEKAFVLGLRDLYLQKAHETATWEDLQNAFSRAMGADLAPFFRQWLQRTDIPELRVEQVDVEQKDGISVTSFHLVQKNNPPYLLQVPVVIQTENGPVKKTLTLNRQDQEFSIETDALPKELLLDPEYDLLRALDTPEIPPIWASFSGAEQQLVILPDDDDQAATYQPLAEMLEQRGADVAYASELSNQDLGEASLLFAGDSPLRESLFAGESSAERGFSLHVRKNPLDLSLTAVLVNSASRDETRAALRKLSHYGSYSFLRFKNGTIQDKQIESSENGIRVSLFTPPPGLPSPAIRDFSTIMDKIAEDRVVYVGETHNQYGDHIMQLQVLQALYARYTDLAVGMEMFPRSSQEALDKYISGEIDSETEFIKQSDYFSVWGFDYRFYRPIINFARKHGLPIIGLNLNKKIVSQVFKKGNTDELSEEELATLAKERNLDVAGYHDRLQEVHAAHAGSPGAAGGSFPGFLQAQALWDETMAESISNYLLAHPEKKMVIIAGNGHVYKDSAIPLRVARRIPGIGQSVLASVNGVETGREQGRKIDYLMFAPPVELEPAPKVGVVLEEEKEEGSDATGRIRIIALSPHGKAEEGGLKKDDVILAVDGQPVTSVTDLKLGLMDKKPGDTVKVKVLRDGIFFGEDTLELEVELSGLPDGAMMMPPRHPKR